MLRLPPVAPAHGFTAQVRLPRDYYVRVAGNDYSVHPAAIGRMVEVAADLAHVHVLLQGRVVAEHQRSWGTALSLTDPEHLAAAARLRTAFQTPTTTTAAASPAPGATPAQIDVMVRDLADYDAAFGVDIDAQIGVRIEAAS
jgi:hypothetical protein